MREVIGQLLPLAVVVAISPIPIIGVVLVLVTPHSRTSGPLFVVGFLAGLAAVGAVALTVANGLDASSGDSTSSVSVVKLGLGIGLVVIALRQWRSRPRSGESAAMPKWMDAIDSFSPLKVLGTGVLFVVVNPKNLVLAIAAASTIGQSGLSGADQAIAYAVFALIGTIGVVIPVGIFFAMGNHAPALLASLKAWMGVHNAAIMAVLCLVIGAKLIGDALPGL